MKRQNFNYINNIQENANSFQKENFVSNNNYYSKSMIEPNINQDLFNMQNYHNLQSSYPNNFNYKYKNNTPFNTNSNQGEYKYVPYNNDKNISSTSQISQEIDRQKIKFDEMVEKAKNLNNCEIYEFDLKKYLPKDNFEDSKTFRKYKDLIKPNIYSNRNNYNNLNKKNNEFKYNDIKDNSLSEIPIRNDNLFEDELSNFNLDNKEIINENIDEEKLEGNNQEQLKKNLMNNIDDNYNSKNINDNNNNIIINNNNSKDKNIDENSNQNSLNQLKDNIQDIDIKRPYFCVYYEMVNINDNNIINKENEDDEQLNDIEKLNKELIKKTNNKSNNIKDFAWYCLDFSEEKPEYIFDEFFNNKEI